MLSLWWHQETHTKSVGSRCHKNCFYEGRCRGEVSQGEVELKRCRATLGVAATPPTVALQCATWCVSLVCVTGIALFPENLRVLAACHFQNTFSLCLVQWEHAKKHKSIATRNPCAKCVRLHMPNVTLLGSSGWHDTHPKSTLKFDMNFHDNFVELRLCMTCPEFPFPSLNCNCFGFCFVRFVLSVSFPVSLPDFDRFMLPFAWFSCGKRPVHASKSCRNSCGLQACPKWIGGVWSCAADSDNLWRWPAKVLREPDGKRTRVFLPSSEWPTIMQEVPGTLTSHDGSGDWHCQSLIAKIAEKNREREKEE